MAGPEPSTWTALEWTDERDALPRLVAAPSESFTLRVVGWSGGYVVFAADGGRDADPSRAPILVSSSSADGVHWSKPVGADVDGPARIAIEDVVEGPAGLLAIGRFEPDTCGGPPIVAGLWHSTDGATWTRVALPRDMLDGHVETIAAGSAGYVATGQRKGGTAGIWLSDDAETWRAAALPKPPSGTLVVDGATSFAGGFVVDGAVVGPEGCGGASAVHPALWWSADGAAWDERRLDGASTAADAPLTVRRLTDRLVVAFQTLPDGLRAWLTTDGRRWTRVAAPAEEAVFGPISDGRRAIVVATPVDDEGPLTFKVVRDDLEVVALTQTGPAPEVGPDVEPWQVAVGPTGVVAVSLDGTELRFGSPSG